ncbi:MAG: ABC transporter ATP-binding protein [Spirochaetales bacterium]|nr:ABC transporter ATP-binding protein [Spirochaetales bacterium]
MSTPAIVTSNICKQFGVFTAVDNVNLSIEKGIIFGLLGANGAGKSTLIRILCGLLAMTSGEAFVGGYDVKNSPEEVKKRIGYMSQKFSLYEDLTVSENIRFFGGIYGLRREQIKKQLSWISEMAGLGGHERQLTRELPAGLKQRLALGCAIIHDPAIIFLDEPTGGVDPAARRVFWSLINNLSGRGTTVLVTTHYLDEAEYCNDITLMHEGKTIAQGSPETLKTSYMRSRMYEVECSPLVEVAETLKKLEWVEQISIFGNLLHLSVGPDINESGITALCGNEGIKLKRLEEIVPSLEDVFINLIETHKEDMTA